MDSETKWKPSAGPIFVQEPAPVDLADVSVFLANVGECFTGKTITLPADANYVARLLVENFDVRERRV